MHVPHFDCEEWIPSAVAIVPFLSNVCGFKVLENRCSIGRQVNVELGERLDNIIGRHKCQGRNHSKLKSEFGVCLIGVG